ncbi:MAG: glycosyltransferase family 4 protein [Pseudomonadota bacterium]
MRIHQIINSFSDKRGGAERIARRLHLGLRDRGFEARLVAIEDCDASGVPGAVTLGFPSAYHPAALLALRRYVRDNVADGDLVHVHLFPASAHVAALSMLGTLRAACVFTEHNTWNRRRSTVMGRIVDRMVYTRFERVFAISDGTAAELLRDRPYLQSHVDVVENGAELRFDAVPDRGEKAAVTILAIGRLAPQKNFGALLNALAGLPDAAFNCVILGEGDLRGELENERDALGLGDNVRLPGHVADTTQYLSEADIFVVPSLWEGFGLVAVEAMNAGLPVVAADVPGLREIVGRSTDCARLVDPSDPASIRSAIADLMADPERRKIMGANGFARATHFSTEKMVERHIAAYQDLIGGSLARAW